MQSTSSESILTFFYFFRDCNLKHINFLEDLRGLEELDLSKNDIVNFDPLYDLNNLKKLSLNRCNNLREISFVENMNTLEVLSLNYSCNVESIIDVQYCRDLKEIYLDGFTMVTKFHFRFIL